MTDQIKNSAVLTVNHPKKEFKCKDVPGLYNFRHYEHPDGSFMFLPPSKTAFL